MRATVVSEKLENQGMFGGKTKYRVVINLYLEGDEEKLIGLYDPYDPLISDSVNLNESSAARLAKIGGGRASGYIRGVTMEFESIQQAGKFEDGVVDAMKKYSIQIHAVRERASVLGSQRDIEL